MIGLAWLVIVVVWLANSVAWLANSIAWLANSIAWLVIAVRTLRTATHRGQTAAGSLRTELPSEQGASRTFRGAFRSAARRARSLPVVFLNAQDRHLEVPERQASQAGPTPKLPIRASEQTTRGYDSPSRDGERTERAQEPTIALVHLEQAPAKWNGPSSALRSGAVLLYGEHRRRRDGVVPRRWRLL